MVPKRYLVAYTEVIGRNMANDVSKIFLVENDGGADVTHKEIISNARIYHEHAVSLAAVLAMMMGIKSIFWIKDQRYAWI